MKYLSAEVSVFNQSFLDKNSIQDHRNDYHKFHPQLALFTSDKLFSNLQLFAWFKPSSRAPSFNELYYSQVGNKALSPEESSRSEEHTSELQSRPHLVCRLLLEKKKKK